jgi:hypothetical protein
MSKAQSALQAGYNCRLLRHHQRIQWSEDLREVKDIDPVVREIETALLGLSSSVSSDQAVEFAALRRRIFALDEKVSLDGGDAFFEPDTAVFHLRKLRPNEELAVRALQGMQGQVCYDLHTLLSAIVGRDTRLAAWYDIGDGLADAIWRLEQSSASQISASERAGLFSAVNRLPKRESKKVAAHFPASGRHRLNSASHHLSVTYEALFTLLGDEPCWLDTPKWDGVTLSYRNKSKEVRRQANTVIVSILDEFERHGWQDPIDLPESIDGEIKQAVYFFNRKNPPVRLYLRSPRFVLWSDGF